MGCQCAKKAEDRNIDMDTTPVNDKPLLEEKEKVIDDQSQLASVSEKKSKKKTKKKKAEETEGNEIITLESIPEQFLNTINSLRTDPKSWADKIEASVSNISMKNGKKSFKAGKSSVTIVKGEEAFKNMASKLRTMNPLPRLEFKNELVFELPDNADDYKAAMPIVQNQLANIRKLGKFSEVKYFFDISIKDPEMSVLLQCVDDNDSFKGQRSEILLRSDIKYVGVSVFNKPEKKFAVYLCYGK
jgi:hypothetical protein